MYKTHCMDITMTKSCTCVTNKVPKNTYACTWIHTDMQAHTPPHRHTGYRECVCVYMYIDTDSCVGLGNNCETVIIIPSWPHDNCTMKNFNIVNLILSVVIILVHSVSSCYLNETFCALCHNFSTCSAVTVNSTHVLIILIIITNLLLHKSIL